MELFTSLGLIFVNSIFALVLFRLRLKLSSWFTWPMGWTSKHLQTWVLISECLENSTLEWRIIRTGALLGSPTEVDPFLISGKAPPLPRVWVRHHQGTANNHSLQMLTHWSVYNLDWFSHSTALEGPTLISNLDMKLPPPLMTSSFVGIFIISLILESERNWRGHFPLEQNLWILSPTSGWRKPTAPIRISRNPNYWLHFNTYSKNTDTVTQRMQGKQGSSMTESTILLGCFPMEVICEIFQWLPTKLVLSLGRLNRQWKNLIQDDRLWYKICVRDRIFPFPLTEIHPKTLLELDFKGSWKDFYRQNYIASTLPILK